jgi:hypothetical protein
MIRSQISEKSFITIDILSVQSSNDAIWKFVVDISVALNDAVALGNAQLDFWTEDVQKIAQLLGPEFAFVTG